MILMTKKILKLEYYRIEQATNYLSCSQEDILHFAMVGKLPTYIENRGWEIEYNEDRNFGTDGKLEIVSIGVDYTRTKGFLQLTQDSIKSIVYDGGIKKPTFL